MKVAVKVVMLMLQMLNLDTSAFSMLAHADQIWWEQSACANHAKLIFFKCFKLYILLKTNIKLKNYHFIKLKIHYIKIKNIKLNLKQMKLNLKTD